jgi:hypothetical protein
MAMASDCAAVAAASTTICTSACDKLSVAGGGFVDAPPPLPPLAPLSPPPQAASARQNPMTRQVRTPAGVHSRPRSFRFSTGIIRLDYWYHSRTSFSIILQISCAIVIE